MSKSEQPVERLKDLKAKYKQNGYRLSQRDAELVREEIINLLQEEKMGKMSQAMEYIIDFPAEIGVEAYLTYYDQIAPNKRRLLDKMMISSEKFQENRNHKSIDRGAALVKQLIANDYDINNILFILQSLCRLMLVEAEGEAKEEQIEEILNIFTLSDRYDSLKNALNKERRIKHSLKSKLDEYEAKVEDLQEELTQLKEQVGELEEKKEEEKSKTMRLWKL